MSISHDLVQDVFYKGWEYDISDSSGDVCSAVENVVIRNGRLETRDGYLPFGASLPKGSIVLLAWHIFAEKETVIFTTTGVFVFDGSSITQLTPSDSTTINLSQFAIPSIAETIDIGAKKGLVACFGDGYPILDIDLKARTYKTKVIEYSGEKNKINVTSAHSVYFIAGHIVLLGVRVTEQNTGITEWHGNRALWNERFQPNSWDYTKGEKYGGFVDASTAQELVCTSYMDENSCVLFYTSHIFDLLHTGQVVKPFSFAARNYNIPYPPLGRACACEYKYRIPALLTENGLYLCPRGEIDRFPGSKLDFLVRDVADPPYSKSSWVHLDQGNNLFYAFVAQSKGGVMLVCDVREARFSRLVFGMYPKGMHSAYFRSGIRFNEVQKKFSEMTGVRFSDMYRGSGDSYGFINEDLVLFAGVAFDDLAPIQCKATARLVSPMTSSVSPTCFSALLLKTGSSVGAKIRVKVVGIPKRDVPYNKDYTVTTMLPKTYATIVHDDGTHLHLQSDSSFDKHDAVVHAGQLHLLSDIDGGFAKVERFHTTSSNVILKRVIVQDGFRKVHVNIYRAQFELNLIYTGLVHFLSGASVSYIQRGREWGGSTN